MRNAWAAVLAAIALVSDPTAQALSRPTPVHTRVAGEVIGPAGPVAGAEVEASYLVERDLLRALPDLPARSTILKTTTDADGRFRFEPPPGRALRLTARHGALVALPLTDVRPGDPTVLELVEACTLRIRGGKAPAFAHVLSYGEEVGRWLPVATASPTAFGLEFVPGLPPGNYRLVAGDAEGNVIEERLVLEPGETRSLLSAWRQGATLHGTVRGEAPAGSVEVFLVGRPWTRATLTRGEFTLAGIPANRTLWEIAIQGAGCTTTPSWQPDAEGQRRDIGIELVRGRSRTVTVCDAGRQPCADALVLAFRQRPDGSTDRRACAFAQADAHGRAALHGLESEPVLLLVLAGGAGSHAIAETEPLAKDLEIVVPQPAAALVLVRDATGTPVPGARVRLRPQEPAMAIHLLQRDAFADRKGRAAFAGLPPGGWHVQVDAPPGAPRDGLMVLPAGAVVPLDWSLEPGLRLLGTVVDEAGKPVADARVVLRDPRDPEERTTRSGPAGEFAFDGLLDQDYIVFAARESRNGTESGLLRGLRPAPAPVEVTIVHEDPTPVRKR